MYFIRLFSALIVIVLCNGALAAGSIPQFDPVLIRIGEKAITKSAFQTVYEKNNLADGILNPLSVDEYLELFVAFQLKVMEAKSRGMDTTRSFQQEFAGYRDQLAQQYLVDHSVSEELLEEAYQRMQYDIRASHILIMLPAHAPPEDTLKVYNQMMELRQRYLDGEDFSELAVAYSEDASVRDVVSEEGQLMRRGNRGDLGYFTVFNMVYPFETAAYNTPVGDISMPVRTAYGYHLIWVADRLPAMGMARVAHIMLMTPPGMDRQSMDEAEEKIHQIYGQIRDGADFEQMTERFSEDQQSAPRGGEMAPFSSNRMVPEFIETISAMDAPFEVSQPIQTNYGWHIIRLLEKTPVPDFEEVLPDIQARVQRDDRSQLGRQVVVERIKQENGWREEGGAMRAIFNMADELVENPEDIELLPDPDAILFSMGDTLLTSRNFVEFFHGLRRGNEEAEAFIHNAYQRYVPETVLAYEKARLEQKYPDFERIIEEYYDGILLFEITDKEVWSKAVTDTVGQRQFFEAHKDRYQWDERLMAAIFTTQQMESALALKDIVANWDDEDDRYREILEYVNRENPLGTSLNEGLFEYGNHPEVLSEITWKEGLHDVVHSNGNYHVVVVDQVLPAQPKTLRETRGAVISDYQNHLEKQWIEELKNKYGVWIDELLVREIAPAY